MHPLNYPIDLFISLFSVNIFLIILEHGKIEFKNFREFLIRQYKSKSLEAQARESFRIFDRDGNGTIDRKELK